VYLESLYIAEKAPPTNWTRVAFSIVEVKVKNDP